jgi:hypothetical protein
VATFMTLKVKGPNKNWAQPNNHCMAPTIALWHRSYVFLGTWIMSKAWRQPWLAGHPPQAYFTRINPFWSGIQAYASN